MLVNRSSIVDGVQSTTSPVMVKPENTQGIRNRLDHRDPHRRARCRLPQSLEADHALLMMGNFDTARFKLM